MFLPVGNLVHELDINEPEQTLCNLFRCGGFRNMDQSAATLMECVNARNYLVPVRKTLEHLSYMYAKQSMTHLISAGGIC